MKRFWSRVVGQEGSLLIGAVVLVLVLTLIGVAIFDLTVVESRLGGDSERQAKAVRVAEAGIYKALRDLSDGNGDGLGGVCPSPRGSCIDFASIAAGTVGTPVTLYSNQAFAGGTFTVTGTPVSASLINLNSSGCYPSPCPNGVQKTIKASVQYSIGFRFSGESWVDFGGTGNLADSFDSSYTASNSGKSGYDSTRACSTSPPPCWGTRGDIRVRNSTGGSGGGEPSDTTIDACHCGLVVGTNGFDALGNPNPTIQGNVTVGGTGSVGLAWDRLSTSMPPAVQNFSNIKGTVTTNAAILPPPVLATCQSVTGSSGYSSGTSWLSGSSCTSKTPCYDGKNVIVRGEVTITPGTYCVHDVTFTSGSTLTVNGKVLILMDHHFDMTGGGSFSDARINNTTLIPSNFEINNDYGGGAPGIVLSSPPGANTYVNVNSPAVNVVLNSGDYYGAMIGRTIVACNSAYGGKGCASNNNVRVHIDVAPNNSPGGVKIYTLVNWEGS